MTHDVFISYASSDKPIAESICNAMETDGIRCWLAPRDILPGRTYSGAISDAIPQSRVMVIVFSARSNRSQFVLREVERAVHSGLIVIPFRIENVEPDEDMEFFLSIPQWLDAMKEPRDEQIKLLVNVVRSNLQALPSQAPPSPNLPVSTEFSVALGNTASPTEAPVSPIEPRPAGPTPLSTRAATPDHPDVAPEAEAARRIVLLYKRNTQPDEYVLKMLETRLVALGYQVFIDRHLTVGIEWAREIDHQICDADAVIPLLSETAIMSDMLAYEIQTAHQAQQRQGSKPRLLPVRIGYEGSLPDTMEAALGTLEYALWQRPLDDDHLMTELLQGLNGKQRHSASAGRNASEASLDLEAVGGAVPLNSRFYIKRSTDKQFLLALARRDSIVRIKGPRQLGKTSLLARGLQHSRETGCKVILTDFQKLNEEDLLSPKTFYLALARLLTRQLRLDASLGATWDDQAGANANFEDFLINYVLTPANAPVLWAIDEADRLFDRPFASQIFGNIRSWHNDRQLNPTGCWSELTLAISYATESHLFITDMNQSPFNVGTQLELRDFTIEQVGELNERHGSPLKNEGELARLYRLVGGHPFLVRRSLYAMVEGALSLADFEDIAATDDGPIGDHLRRIVVLLARNRENYAALCEVLRGKPCPSAEAFFHLRSAGVLIGNSAKDARLRCQLYAMYLEHHLL